MFSVLQVVLEPGGGVGAGPPPAPGGGQLRPGRRSSSGATTELLQLDCVLLILGYLQLILLSALIKVF